MSLGARLALLVVALRKRGLMRGNRLPVRTYRLPTRLCIQYASSPMPVTGNAARELWERRFHRGDDRDGDKDKDRDRGAGKPESEEEEAAVHEILGAVPRG